MRAVIMAGGKGTRISGINRNIPKPMFPILGKPVLEYQIESLRRSGIKDITLIVGYLGNIIINYFGDGRSFGVNIRYIEETEPLGTAGSLFYLREEKENFILIFGDLIFDIDFSRFMGFHNKKGAFITLYGHPNSHPNDSDIIVNDSDFRVVKILSKGSFRNFNYHNFVNAGIYCVKPEALKIIKNISCLDFEKNLIAEFIKVGKVFAYKSTEYIKDMGTPHRFESVLADVKNGIVEARNLKNKQKAVFLDRDGTINEYKGFLRKIDDFKLLPTVPDAIAKLNSSPFLTIVITNQPVIARGEITFQYLEEIHKRMETTLGEKGAFLDDVFFCPHHPDKGYYGEIEALKINCDCRKPKIGMLEEASKIYNIDLAQSWFVGDTTVDIQTGKNAGMRTVLLKTGESGLDGKYKVTPDYEAKNLIEAVEYILNSI